MPDSLLSVTPATGIIRQKVLVRMRWFAVLGQLAALIGGTQLFSLTLPLFWPLAIIAASALFNLVAMMGLRKTPQLQNGGTTFALAFDMLQLALLLHVTGGLSNPFALLMLAPLVAGASILAGRSVIILTVLGFIAYTLLLIFSPPLIWPGETPLPPLFVAGAYVALVVTSLFLVLYVRKVARESRRLAEALGASRLLLAKEQKISAFGALAAAVAHELGSPLSTIAVVAKDLRPTEEQAEDVALLNQQVARCRSILSDFARYGMVDETSFHSLPLTRWLLRVAEPYRRDGVHYDVVVVQGEGTEPSWPVQPALIHGVANPLQNAFQFARHLVRVEVIWKGQAVTLRIFDDGPGFPKDLLASLGEGAVNGADASLRPAQHMGLGLFIAKALLQRSGANVHFANQTYSDGTVTGAAVTLEWQRLPV